MYKGVVFQSVACMRGKFWRVGTVFRALDRGVGRVFAGDGTNSLVGEL